MNCSKPYYPLSRLSGVWYVTFVSSLIAKGCSYALAKGKVRLLWCFRIVDFPNSDRLGPKRLDSRGK